MLEPHEPRGERDDEFVRSTPDLSPNLSDTPVVEERQIGHMQISPDTHGSQSHVADEIYAGHSLGAERFASISEQIEQVTNEIEDIRAGSRAIERLIESISEDRTPEGNEKYRHYAETSLALQERFKELPDLRQLRYEQTQAGDKADSNIYRGTQHLQSYREAYENSATNDYNAARAENPGQYPDPLTFGDNYQPPQAQ